MNFEKMKSDATSAMEVFSRYITMENQWEWGAADIGRGATCIYAYAAPCRNDIAEVVCNVSGENIYFFLTEFDYSKILPTLYGFVGMKNPHYGKLVSMGDSVLTEHNYTHAVLLEPGFLALLEHLPNDVKISDEIRRVFLVMPITRSEFEYAMENCVMDLLDRFDETDREICAIKTI